MFNSLLIKKNKFTLIELIVVIGILAILTNLVLPNIKGIEGEAKGVALATERKSVQTAVDMYLVDHVEKPVLADEVTGEVEEITIGVPGIISMDKLYPEYLRDFPSTAGAKYWLDYTGKVWASLADAPVISNDAGNLSWEAVDGAVEYIVYEYSPAGSNAKFDLLEVARTNETTYSGVEGKDYVAQSIDKRENESVLVSIEYIGYPVLKEETDTEVVEYNTENDSNYTYSLPLYSNEIYVSAATGDDNNNGAMNEPVKTIQQAINMSVDQSNIYLASGEYVLTSDMDIDKSLNIIGNKKDESIIKTEENYSDKYMIEIITDNINVSLKNLSIDYNQSTNEYPELISLYEKNNINVKILNSYIKSIPSAYGTCYDALSSDVIFYVENVYFDTTATSKLFRGYGESDYLKNVTLNEEYFNLSDLAYGHEPIIQ